MRALTLFAGAAIAFASTAASAQAQRIPRANTITIDRGQFSITPYAGYLLSQNFLKGPLSSTLSVQSAPIYGLQASMPLAPGASLIGSVAYASCDLKAGLPIIGGISLGTSGTTIYDLSAELRGESFAKNGRGFIPIVELGGGAIHRTVSVAGLTARTTDFQVSGALGADVPISSNIALRVLAKDHYGKADFGSFAGIDASTRDLHAFALEGGLRLAF